MAGRARIQKLTPAASKAVIDGVAAGLARPHVAKAAGVALRTLQRWLLRGRRGDPASRDDRPYMALLAGVEKAEAAAVAERMAVIRRAAVGTTETTTKQTRTPEGTVKVERTKRNVFEWTAAAWWLERMHPEEYGSDRKRVRELEKKVDDLLKALGRTAVGPTALEGAAGGAEGTGPSPAAAG